MLEIVIPSVELWDDANQQFIITKSQKLKLEHSLVSISKWESKWCKSFLSNKDKTLTEILDYIKCMTITQNVDPEIYKYIPDNTIDEIVQYIKAPMTATTFHNQENTKSNNEIVTAELIYYWMIALNIPREYEKWHINKLITLIRVCEIKNQKPKKRSKSEIASNYAALNAARKAKLNTKG